MIECRQLSYWQARTQPREIASQLAVQAAICRDKLTLQDRLEKPIPLRHAFKAFALGMKTQPLWEKASAYIYQIFK